MLWALFLFFYATTLFFQLFWIGLADEVFYYYIACAIALFFSIVNFFVFPKAGKITWLLLSLFLIPIVLVCFLIFCLFLESPLYLGNEQIPVTWTGYWALTITLFAYLFQGVWLLKTCPLLEDNDMKARRPN